MVTPFPRGDNSRIKYIDDLSKTTGTMSTILGTNHKSGKGDSNLFILSKWKY